MPRYRTRPETCERKVAYSAKFVAENAASALLWSMGTKLYPYRCEVCGMFHLSHYTQS